MSKWLFGCDLVCPNCGHYVDKLHERTGWCEECAGASKQPNPTGKCINCGAEMFSRNPFAKYCSKPACRLISRTNINRRELDASTAKRSD